MRAWLFRIAANLHRDHLRRGRRDVAGGEGLPDAADPAGLPIRNLIADEELTRALETLDSLPPRQREVLYLAAVEDLSLADISDVLGVSRDAAKVSLSLARKRMRSALEPSCEDVK